MNEALLIGFAVGYVFGPLLVVGALVAYESVTSWWHRRWAESHPLEMCAYEDALRSVWVKGPVD